MPITLGCDPEYFVRDSNSGAIIPAVGIVPGTKEQPFELSPGYGVHEDCVTVELTVPYTDDTYELLDRLHYAKNEVYQRFLAPNDLSLITQAACQFDPALLQSEQAQTFGCAPDYDAYTGGQARSRPPREITKSNWRFAGHHIHIGTKANCPPFVTALFCDVFVLLPSIAYQYITNTRSVIERGKWYGQPGIYREKPYGIEYRSMPPSVWNDSSIGRWAYNRAYAAGFYVATTPAETLREALRALPWRDIKQACTLSRETLSESGRNDAVELLQEVYNRLGISLP
jgi:hypothetical protein